MMEVVLYTTVLWGFVLLFGSSCAAIADADSEMWFGMMLSGAFLIGVAIVMAMLEWIAGGVA